MSARIQFPSQLESLLHEGELQAPLRLFADRVGEILKDNQMSFFPDYTDHGINHVNQVLKSCISLVPEKVWSRGKQSSELRLLTEADAAVIVGATLLHDIGMHLHPTGFLELISEASRFQPLYWFSENQDGHAKDRDWYELWSDYSAEIRRYSDRRLAKLLGVASVRDGWRFRGLPSDIGQWERNHMLVIGEFIRRHHARLAHEISRFGFPGLQVGTSEGEFPAISSNFGFPFSGLADLIGLTARSHGISLRLCKRYLDSAPQYIGTPRPMGCAVLYAMALLRVADYLQIDRRRAPAVLLQLRTPPSPDSIIEWQKHLAVQSLAPAAYPRGRMITVSTDIPLPLYLQVSDLIDGLQQEIDHSTAVLDEAYGIRGDLGLDELNLSIRRVESNLSTPEFRASLPYVPARTGFAADPNLLTLLVEPLYGKSPGVGVRELMQNGVDAVAELHAWCATRKISRESLHQLEQASDVAIDFVCRDDGSWVLRVADKGIGMQSHTISEYFLRAGASFRQSGDWAQEFLDDQGKPRVLRAGRFGIGAFALFLLGPTFRLTTRHVSCSVREGYFLTASINSQLIEIRRVEDIPIGTTVEVDLFPESVAALEIHDPRRTLYGSKMMMETDWFCWDTPVVSRTVSRRGETAQLGQEFAAPISCLDAHPEWAAIHPPGFDAVLWTFASAPSLVCNGIRVGKPEYRGEVRIYWPGWDEFKPPNISVVDSEANLPLTIQRFGLSRSLPFADEIRRDVAISFIAHALVCGPNTDIVSHPRGSHSSQHPLARSVFVSSYNPDVSRARIPDVSHKRLFSDVDLRWCSTAREFIPADPWLWTLLGVEAYLVYGVLDTRKIERDYSRLHFTRASSPVGGAISWDGHVETNHYSAEDDKREADEIFSEVLSQLCEYGIGMFGPVLGARATVSFRSDVEITSRGSASHRQIEDATAERREVEISAGNVTHLPGLLESILEDQEEVQRAAPSESRWTPAVLYVAEISTKRPHVEPRSFIARVWNEVLGKHAIPFEHAERTALIAHARANEELARHIAAWEQMKKRIQS